MGVSGGHGSPPTPGSGCFSHDLKLLPGEISHKGGGGGEPGAGLRVPPGSACAPPGRGTADQTCLPEQTRGWETQEQGSSPGRPHPRGTQHLSSHPATARARCKLGIEVQAPASPWAAVIRSGRERGRGPRGIAGLQTSGLCTCPLFLPSERPFPTSEAGPGKPNQTSLQSLSQSTVLRTTLSLD